MKKRGQKVKLQYKTGNRVIEIIVKEYDPQSGYLGVRPDGSWMHYPTSEWKEVK
jgi:hypothetical protein